MSQVLGRFQFVCFAILNLQECILNVNVLANARALELTAKHHREDHRSSNLNLSPPFTLNARKIPSDNHSCSAQLWCARGEKRRAPIHWYHPCLV